MTLTELSQRVPFIENVGHKMSQSKSTLRPIHSARGFCISLVLFLLISYLRAIICSAARWTPRARYRKEPSPSLARYPWFLRHPWRGTHAYGGVGATADLYASVSPFISNISVRAVSNQIPFWFTIRFFHPFWLLTKGLIQNFGQKNRFVNQKTNRFSIHNSSF